MQGAYLGPSFSDNEIEKSLSSLGAVYERFSEEKLLEITAKELLVSVRCSFSWRTNRKFFKFKNFSNSYFSFGNCFTSNFCCSKSGNWT